MNHGGFEDYIRGVALLVALFCWGTLTGCNIIGQLGTIITAGVQGADDWIPDHAPPYIEPYIAPWLDPGFDSPNANPVSHDGNTAGSFVSPGGAWQAPGGAVPVDGNGGGYYGQVTPSAGFAPPAREDSFGSFQN